MRRRGFALAAAALALLPALPAGEPAAGPVAGLFLDGPPPAHTGGFGEPTCAACHFDAPADPAGALRLEGLPAEYVPGEEYRLVLSLRHPEMRRGGYQLSARFAGGAAEGEQAGILHPLDPRSGVTPRGGVLYAHQTSAGAELADEAAARWEVRWTAPPEAGAPVVFHLAGNAANGDDSQFGDRIYTRQLRVPAAAGATTGSR